MKGGRKNRVKGGQEHVKKIMKLRETRKKRDFRVSEVEKIKQIKKTDFPRIFLLSI